MVVATALAVYCRIKRLSSFHMYQSGRLGAGASEGTGIRNGP